MSRLRLFEQGDGTRAQVDTTDRGTIERTLGGLGVRFEAWQATRPLAPTADTDAILAAYAADVERLKSEGGYRSVDVVRMLPDHPERDAMRGKFLDEHTHAEDEVRFFVEGSGLFCLHLGERVALVTCERGDLIGVPAGTRHWFDMGPRPHFTAIRLFVNPSGWVAAFTGDDIAKRFPKYE
jgi:1,2-dihydroxy-3-keto-5-methylthiopentene dioxygenase